MSKSPLPIRHSPFANLDADVRRFDEDRWLASRFAPADVRARLIAIYALNHEIARTGEVVGTPQLADIRFAWWREAIEDVHAGRPVRAHPVLEAYAAAAPGLSAERWTDIIEARRLANAQLTSWAAVDTFIEHTAGAVMQLALHACAGAPATTFLTPILRDAALAWGHIALARSSAFAAIAPSSAEEGLARAAAAQERLRARALRPPASAFPAIGYVALAPGYLRALRAGKRDRALLPRQFELIFAAATGRL